VDFSVSLGAAVRRVSQASRHLKNAQVLKTSKYRPDVRLDVRTRIARTRIQKKKKKISAQNARSDPKQRTRGPTVEHRGTPYDDTRIQNMNNK
jgi:hypothetical protein